MFDWSLTLPIIINTLVVSIPEQTFLVMFSLILMRRFDFIDFRKANIIRFVIAVVPAALLSNILRSITGLNSNFMPLIGFILLFFLLITVFGIKSLRGIIKAFLAAILSFLVVIAVQMLYFPFVMYGTSITVEKVGEFGILAIIVSLIDRVVQICIIGFLLLNKKSFIKLNFFKVIIRNRALGYLSGLTIVLNLAFIYGMWILVFYNKILLKLPPINQLIIIAAIVIYPVFNLSVLLYVITYSVNKYTHLRVYIQEESRVLRLLVNLLLKQRRYDEIDMELVSFEKEVKKLI